jgi:hypothetical protein
LAETLAHESGATQKISDAIWSHFDLEFQGV